MVDVITVRPIGSLLAILIRFKSKNRSMVRLLFFDVYLFNYLEKKHRKGNK